MSQYIAIAAIRIEHNYYNPPENSFVGLEPTPETKKLMRQRGVMLRQSRGNEWQWIMADDASGFADKDVLELSMIVKDPCFLQQIECQKPIAILGIFSRKPSSYCAARRDAKKARLQ